MDIQSTGAVPPDVTAVSGTTPTTMASPPPTPALDGTLASISQQLGLGVGAVQSALKQGLSITDLAQQQGVSRGALVTAVQSQVQQNRQASGQPALDQTTLERMVGRAFDHHNRLPTAAADSTSAPPGAGSTSAATPAGSADGFSLLA